MNQPQSQDLMRVAKFGGTSLACSENIRLAADIVMSRDKRQYVIVSAPGKRNSNDTKITDMLYNAYDSQGTERQKSLELIKERFCDIVTSLEINLDLEEVFKTISQSFGNNLGRDYAASRGEYIMGMIFSRLLGYEFIDAAEVIHFAADGSFDSEKTNEKLKERLEKTSCAVIPGFYGSMPNNTIKTFSRGGSDITGALVARAVNADVYENFTDVDGFMMTDPKIVKDPAVMELVTYDQLRALSYMGASVLHEDSIYPVMFSGIPINIRNTFNSSGSGTLIVSKGEGKAPMITGIAGKKNFSTVIINKNMSDISSHDFYKKASEVFYENGISIEHIPGGIDSVGFIINTNNLMPVRRRLLLGLCRKLSPEYALIRDGIALICLVGDGIIEQGGYTMDIIKGLFLQGINAEIILKPPYQKYIIIGVAEQEYERAITTLYSLASTINQKSSSALRDF